MKIKYISNAFVLRREHLADPAEDVEVNRRLHITRDKKFRLTYAEDAEHFGVVIYRFVDKLGEGWIAIHSAADPMTFSVESPVMLYSRGAIFTEIA